MSALRKTVAPVWLLLPAGTLLLTGGCARGNQDQRFTPSETAAQRILETALTAWQKDTLPSLVEESSPPIHLIDTQRPSGRKLTSFSVLGPTTGDAQRCFAVRLTLDNPPEEVRARFVVLGLDPLWVLRYEDYEMISHWDCPPEKESN
jgi:hypothetical protein